MHHEGNDSGVLDSEILRYCTGFVLICTVVFPAILVIEGTRDGTSVQK